MSPPRRLRDIAPELGISHQTALKLLHQGSFGARGKGYRVINPEARRPQYLITEAGLEHYKRATG